MISAWLNRPSPAMISLLCLGCRIGLRRGFFETAKRYNIPLLFSGLGEPESSFATQFFSSRTSNKFLSLMLGLAEEMARNPRYMLKKPSLPYWMLVEYLYAFSSRPIMQNRICPDMRLVRLFEYIGWDEQQITTTIQSELGWVNYGYSESSWRSDCKVSLLKNHLYYETLGFTKNDELVSNLVRMGAISRQDGLERVERENVIPEQFLREFFQEMDIPEEAYQTGLAKARELRRERLAA